MTQAGHAADERSEALFAHEQIRVALRRWLDPASASDPLLILHGPAGTGRTTLLAAGQRLAEGLGYRVIDGTIQYGSVTALMSTLAARARRGGMLLPALEAQLVEQRRQREALDQDPHRRIGPPGPIRRVPVVSSPDSPLDRLLQAHRDGVLRPLHPPHVDSQTVEAARWPARALTPAAIEGLRVLADRGPLLLTYDDAELAGPALLPWLEALLEEDLAPTLRVALVLEEPPSSLWRRLDPYVHRVPVRPLDPRESRHFLSVLGVGPGARQQKIVDRSGGLPLLLSWLASTDGRGSPDGTLAGEVLASLPDPRSATHLALAALPRLITGDTLALLTEGSIQESGALLDWLRSRPEITAEADGLRFHPQIRRLLLTHLDRTDRARHRTLHGRLADYYRDRRAALPADGRARWGRGRWRRLTIESLYHALMADPVDGWRRTVVALVETLRDVGTVPPALSSLLFLPEVWEELTAVYPNESAPVREYLLASRDAVREQDLQRLLSHLESLDSLPPATLASLWALQAEDARDQEPPARALALLDQALDRHEAPWLRGRRALTRLGAGDLEGAVEDLDAILIRNPGDSWAATLRGLIHLRRDHLLPAREDLERALRRFPALVTARAALGEVERRLGHPARAIEHLDETLDAHPRDVHALVQRGLARLEQGQYAQATADFDRVLALRPGLAVAVAGRGESHRLSGRPEAALPELERALSLEPTLTWARASLAAVLQTLGRSEEANDALTRLRRDLPDHPWPTRRLVRAAAAHYAAGNPRAAAVLLQGEGDGQSLSAPLQGILGELWRQVGEPARALPLLERALAVISDRAWLWAARGDCQRRLGRIDLARADFDRALILAPGEPWTLAGRGECHRLRGRPARALADFDAALAAGSATGWLHGRRGDALRLLDRPEEAIAAFDLALATTPDDPWVLVRRAESLRRIGRVGLALADFDLAHALGSHEIGGWPARRATLLGPGAPAGEPPQSALMLYNLIASANTAAPEGAVDRLRMAREALTAALGPVPAGRHFGRATLAALAGRRDEALDALERALGLAPAIGPRARGSAAWEGLATDPRFQKLTDGDARRENEGNDG